MPEEEKKPDVDESYKACAGRLMEDILKSGEGQALRDLKVLMDSREEAINILILAIPLLQRDSRRDDAMATDAQKILDTVMKFQ